MALELFKGKIRFDRHEFAGSFGDIGTDFPLIVSLILICGLDPASVLIVYGAMQVLTGLIYGLPMPVQPLKAMSVIMITQKLSGNILYGAGLAIGVIMMILSLTGLLDWFGRVVPKSVVRGIQFGLGMQLAMLALKEYVPAQGIPGYWLAFISFVLIIILLRNRKYPAALFVILLGIIYALSFKVNISSLGQSIHLSIPKINVPTKSDILQGLVLLALPQLFLSVGNSILATRQVVQDLFPDRSLSIKKIGLTYSAMNLISPFFSGIPVCHGSGGFVGHYTFGARTGGSVCLYGMIYLLIGLFFSQGFSAVIEFFPKPTLGIILLFEGWALMRLVKDSPKDLGIIFLVGLLCVGVQYGYIIGLVAGSALYYLSAKGKISFDH